MSATDTSLPSPPPSPWPVSPWIARFASLIPTGKGTVLDLACGSGRHLRYLAERGHRVVGVDIDLRGTRDLAGNEAIELIEADLENGQPADVLTGRQHAAIIVTNYLHRPLMDDLVNALEPGGVLIYETFAVGNARFGKPSSPSFLLRSGELLELCRDRLQVVAYEHGEVSSPKAAIVQRICAVKDLAPGQGLDGDPEPRPLPVAL